MGASRWIPAKLPGKLLKIRKNLGLSQDEMLERLGYGASDGLFRSSISAYERGRREPPLEVLLAYARVSDLTVEILIDDKLEFP